MTHTHAAHRINVLCRLYFDANYHPARRRCEVSGSDGRRLIADVGAQIEFRKEITAAGLEEIIEHLIRISDLESGNYGICSGGQEFQPNDHDYVAARDQSVQEENDDMNAAIEALLPGGNDE